MYDSKLLKEKLKEINTLKILWKIWKKSKMDLKWPKIYKNKIQQNGKEKNWEKV